MTEIDNKLRHIRWEKNYIVFVIVFLSAIITLFSFFPILLSKWDSWMVGSVLALYLLIIGIQARMWIQINSDYNYIYSVFKIGLATNYLKHLHPKLTEKQIIQSIDSANQELNFRFLPFFKEYRKVNYRSVLGRMINSFYENIQGESVIPYFSLEGSTEFLKDFERELLEEKSKVFIRE